MKTSSIAASILVLLAFAGCDDSSADSSSDSAVSLEGTWVYHEGSELRELLRFQGDRIHHESYRMRCQLSLTEGTWTLQDNILRVTSDTTWSRSYDPDAKDSASFCAWEPSAVTVTGSLRMELANVAAASFDAKSHKITVSASGTKDSLIIKHFVKR